MREVLRRLGVTAPHVLFGHTHRSGPVARDDPREWTTPAGSRLVNTGSWVYQPHFLSARAERVALLAGHRGRRRDGGRRRGSSGCWASGSTGSCDPRREAGGVAGDAGADLELEHALGVVGVLDERERAGRRDGDARPFATTSPSPSSTAQTPPASYGPE